MKKLILFLLILQGSVTSIVYGQEDSLTDTIGIPTTQLDWLLKRNADAEMYKKELGNCDSSYSILSDLYKEQVKVNGFYEDASKKSKQVLQDCEDDKSQLQSTVDLYQKKIAKKDTIIKIESGSLIAIVIGIVVKSLLFH